MVRLKVKKRGIFLVVENTSFHFKCNEIEGINKKLYAQRKFKVPRRKKRLKPFFHF